MSNAGKSNNLTAILGGIAVGLAIGAIGLGVLYLLASRNADAGTPARPGDVLPEANAGIDSPSAGDLAQPGVAQNTPGPSAPTAESAGDAPAASQSTLQPTPLPQVAPGEVLPADPQQVSFQTDDGVTLSGVYYPAAVNPAPIVVLMHWAQGDKSDWTQNAQPKIALAQILQNRDPAFAVAERGPSYGVLVFDFRGYGSSGSSSDQQNMYRDAQAAVQFAKTLPGGDPNRVMTVGASIGADGALDGCVGPEPGQPQCIGAVSLSPGSYIGLAYGDAAINVGNMPIACLASFEDQIANQTCLEGAAASEYNATFFEGAAHGMDLFFHNQQPDTLTLILEFLDDAVARVS